MRLSNMADYAVVVMGAAARHCGGARTSATELASETGIALPTVQKLVSILGKAGCSARRAALAEASSSHARLRQSLWRILSRQSKARLR